MLRLGNNRPLSWADKTMSGLRADRLEACGKYLSSLSSLSLFDDECTDADAEKLFSNSFYASEEKEPVLHTIEGLRTQVLSSFPQEFALLTGEEHDLAVHLALAGGSRYLSRWDDLAPASSLSRRLWCTVSGSGDGFVLRMPKQLCVMAVMLLVSDQHSSVREIVGTVQDSIDDSLYLLGITQAFGPLRHLESLLKDTFVEGCTTLMTRMLHAGYDYVYDSWGNEILLHPGLADPDSLLDIIPGSSGAFMMNLDDLSAALDSLEDIEGPLWDRMLFQIADVVRPEISAEDAVEDLVILAKQNVSASDMREVLSSMLIVLPTDEMYRALDDLRTGIPRWISLDTPRVQ